MNKRNIKITNIENVFKGFTSTYNVETLNSFNPAIQLKDTESADKNKQKNLLSELRGFKFVKTIVLVFKKIKSEYKISSKAKIFINECDIDNVLNSFYATIIINIQESLGKGSGWIVYLVIDQTISISEFNPLAGRILN